jgi:hypothetical protein
MNEAGSHLTDAPRLFKSARPPLFGPLLPLEVGECHLDQVQVGVVQRQIVELDGTGCDRFADASNFGCEQIVEHHDIAAPERGPRALRI